MSAKPKPRKIPYSLRTADIHVDAPPKEDGYFEVYPHVGPVRPVSELAIRRTGTMRILDANEAYLLYKREARRDKRLRKNLGTRHERRVARHELPRPHDVDQDD